MNSQHINKNSNLILGTVQFGLDYGISNTQGQITVKEADKILNYAHQEGIQVLDTAQAYGNCESVLGGMDVCNRFKVVSKIAPSNISNLEISIDNTLNKLKTASLYGLLYHDFESYLNYPSSYKKLQQQKEKKKIEKIGFSLYNPKELEILFERKLNFDLIQFPYNIFDRRFEPYFKELKNRKVEIHTRSVFLQGLFFMKEIPKYFNEISGKIVAVRDMAIQNNVSTESVCLNYCLQNDNISKVLIGITTLNELKSNINCIKELGIIKKLKNQIDMLEVSDAKMILPINWNLQKTKDGKNKKLISVTRQNNFSNRWLWSFGKSY